MPLYCLVEINCPGQESCPQLPLLLTSGLLSKHCTCISICGRALWFGGPQVIGATSESDAAPRLPLLLPYNVDSEEKISLLPTLHKIIFLGKSTPNTKSTTSWFSKPPAPKEGALQHKTFSPIEMGLFTQVRQHQS